MYAHGVGIKQDWSQAKPWFEKAAAQGDAKAQVALGVMYANGHGVKKDLAKAKELVKKAADQGQAEANEILKELEKKKTE
jgi:TPR repeat protein